MSAPCQLLGVGLCGTVGAINVALTVSEVGTHALACPSYSTLLLCSLQRLAKSGCHKICQPFPWHTFPHPESCIAMLLQQHDIQGLGGTSEGAVPRWTSQCRARLIIAASVAARA